MEKLLNDLFSDKKVVVITGAGISTLSGIRPFRGNNGLYTEKNKKYDKDPMYYLSKACLDNEPEVFYEFYKENMMLGDYEPNVVHNVLSELEKRGLIEGIITQNIDRLHQDSGSENVIDIHGNGNRFYCTGCGEEHTAEDYKESCTCHECGGLVRPDIVLYDEGYGEGKIEKCYELINDADIVLVLGTSLTVSTATGLLSYFIRLKNIRPKLYYYSRLVYENNSESIYIVNDERTMFDSYGKRYSDLKEVFERIQKELETRKTDENSISKVKVKTDKE